MAEDYVVSLFEVELHWRESVACEEDMLLVDRINERITRDIDFKCPCTVSIVGQQIITRLEVFEPLGIPPAVGHADLRIGGLNNQVECA